MNGNGWAGSDDQRREHRVDPLPEQAAAGLSCSSADSSFQRRISIPLLDQRGQDDALAEALGVPDGRARAPAPGCGPAPARAAQPGQPSHRQAGRHPAHPARPPGP